MNDIPIINGFQSLQVLVVGDVMLDKYVFGKVERVSPEAPVPVLSWQKELTRLGGAANVALNTMALGAETFLCGVVGTDEGGNKLFRLMEESGLVSQWMVQTNNRPTTVKTRFIAEGQHLLRLDSELTSDCEVQEQEKIIENVKEIIACRNPNVIILQDYNKGVLTKNVISSIIELAKNSDIFVTVDPKAKHFWEFDGVDLFKPNLKEIKEALPFSIGESKKVNLKKGSDYLSKRLHNKRTLITLSENGIFAQDKNESIFLPTQKRNVADVCGAGDAVIAIVSLALANGATLTEMAELANLAGGQIVEKVGVVPIDLNQLKTELLKQEMNR